MKILVTGAGGFVGNRLIQHLHSASSDTIVAACRRMPDSLPPGTAALAIGDLQDGTDWRPALSGVDVVVHLAARVHVMNDLATDPLAEFRRVNVNASRRLAEQAVDSGARRFVYVSSIKVNGEATSEGHPFRPGDAVNPSGHYAISKWEAESVLRELCAATKMELVVVRPPLIYGPGVRANFRSMMRWLYRGIPMPFGAINNQRSLVALDNLCDLLRVCIQHPAAAGETFLAADGEDVSTTELLHRLGAALGRPARLLAVPQRWLSRTLSIAGKGDLADRLCASLQVDGSNAHHILGWTPPVSLDIGLARAASAFVDEFSRP